MELVADGSHTGRGRIMPKVTQLYALERVAQTLGEDLEMLEAIVSNDDNLKRPAFNLRHIRQP
jgi:hypothetical protein